MPLVAIASGKGGVGKTTCAVNLCAALRELGHDPVLLDADSGGDATWLLGFRSADTALDVLRGRKDLTAAVSSTTEEIRLLPSSPRLIELESADVNMLAERLRKLSDGALIVAVAVMVDKRRALTGAVMAAAQEGGLDVVGTIPRSVAVPESGNEGVSVLRYAPTNAASAGYRELAPRILQTLPALVR